jgi:hypothetical protein
MRIITFIAMVAISVASYVKPTSLWENNQIRCIQNAPFVPVQEQTNIYNEYTWVFITSDGDEIPAYIEGAQHDQESIKGTWGEIDGITRSGKPWKDGYVAVYVSVEFEKDCKLDRCLITGPHDYKVEIDLDEFWRVPHEFKTGEKCGISFYL